MVIDFSVIMKSFDDVPMKKNLSSDEVATLRDIVIEALLFIGDSERISGEEKFQRYELARKIGNGETDLKVEDIALIKKQVGIMYSPLVVGQAWNILDGK